MEAILPIFAEFGIPGLIIGYLLWTNSKKEDRISALTDKLVERNDTSAQVTLMLERVLMAVQGDRP